MGRQEDAHEYLRCLLDLLHETHIASVQPKPPAAAHASTWIHRVFGGKLRTQIQCIGVKYESSVFEPFLDLSLQIFRCRRSAVLRTRLHKCSVSICIS
jgi:ubiquitin carboxyl-terminal hydrolase 36/42